MKNVSRKLYAIYFIAIYLLAIVVDILTFISNIHIIKTKSENETDVQLFGRRALGIW